jgi:hypothetical protein
MVHTEYEVFRLAALLFPEAWKLDVNDGLWKDVRIQFRNEQHKGEVWYTPDIRLSAFTWKKLGEKLRQAHASLQVAAEG